MKNTFLLHKSKICNNIVEECIKCINKQNGESCLSPIITGISLNGKIAPSRIQTELSLTLEEVYYPLGTIYNYD